MESRLDQERAIVSRELAQIRQSNMFSAAELRQEVTFELVSILDRSCSSGLDRVSTPERLGDERELCSHCSEIPLTWRSRNIFSNTVIDSIALDREIFLGSLAAVESRTLCALCRVVSCLLGKDRSLSSFKKSASDECILQPAVGSFQTYVDRRRLCDVFYGNHPCS